MTYAQNKKELAATLFPIEGLSGTKYRFKILKVRERIPDDNKRPIRLQKWADSLWRHELRCPVFPTSRFRYPAFLIPESDSQPVGDSIEIVDVPDKVYHIDITDQTIEIDIEQAQGPERELICRMLERPFTDKILSMRNLFWKDQWTLFYLQEPANSSVSEDIMNAYRGYKFGVVFVEGIGLHLAVDVRTHYVARKSLSEYSTEERNTILGSHLDLETEFKDRPRFLRDNGFAKFPCRYTGETGETVSQHTIDEAGTTVLDYYRERYPHLDIHPDALAVFTQDKEERASVASPSLRLFPIFGTDYVGVRNCSVQPHMTPTERFLEIQNFLKYLKGIKYAGIPVKINDHILVANRQVFIPPKLEFGAGYIVKPFLDLAPPCWNESFDSQIVKYRSRKLPALYRNGPYHNEPLPGIVLLYPQSMERTMREMFLKELEREINLQTGQDMKIIQQRKYQVGGNERMGSSLLTLATEIQSTTQRCLLIAILWNNLYKSIHGNLKNTLQKMLSQCAWERTVSNICNQYNPGRAKSQIRNLALGVITEAGVKPWVLAEPLYHDLHIGIDLLHGRIGYHFLYGTGGRIIDTYSGSTIQRGRMHEAIKRPEIRNRLLQSIQSIVNSGHKIGTIVIHRDGRWWPSESDGLNEALDRLKRDGILDKETRCAVVEIRKNHMPIRIFTSTSGSEPYFQNPLPGTYFILDSNRILLTTTGRPGTWDEPGGRTASTLLLNVVETLGNFTIEEIGKDAYHLTHLNWSAPDIDISLPVTVRWTDELLRETLRPRTEENDDQAEYEEEDENHSYMEDEI
jgi:hypothetical protein